MKELFGKLFTDDDIDDDLEYSKLDMYQMQEGANLCIDITDLDECGIFIRQHHRHIIIERDQMRDICNWLIKQGVISVEGHIHENKVHEQINTNGGGSTPSDGALGTD